MKRVTFEVFLYALIAGLTAYKGINGPIDANAIATIVLAVAITVKAKYSLSPSETPLAGTAYLAGVSTAVLEGTSTPTTGSNV